MIKRVTIILFLTGSVSPLLSQTSRRARYLDPSFPVETGTSVVPEKEASAKKSADLLQQGIRLNKQQKDRLAIEKYEEALELFATADIYYHYGNSLANIGELENSVRAYEIAIRNNFPSPELAWYNMGCAFSLQHQKEKTYETLRQAILYGYPNIDFFKTDGDLAFIRTDAMWSSKFAELKEIFRRGMVPLPRGKKFRAFTMSSSDFYAFCPDGKVVVDNPSSSVFRSHRKYGTWRYTNFMLFLSLNRETGEKGAGEPLICNGDGGCEYREYRPYAGPIAEKEVIYWQAMQTPPSPARTSWEEVPMSGEDCR